MPSFLESQKTVDDFVIAVPWDDFRTVLVHRRQHAGREWLRFRTWNRHRDEFQWYPTQRSFVVPIAQSHALGDALHAAAQGESLAKPAWLVEREEAEEAAVAREWYAGMHGDVVEQARIRMEKKRRKTH